MSEIERVLRAVLADVREQRVALEAAVEKIYSGTALREALSVDLREMGHSRARTARIFCDTRGSWIADRSGDCRGDLGIHAGCRSLRYSRFKSRRGLHRSRVVRSRPRRRHLGFAVRTSKCDCGCPEAKARAGVGGSSLARSVSTASPPTRRMPTALRPTSCRSLSR